MKRITKFWVNRGPYRKCATRDAIEMRELGRRRSKKKLTLNTNMDVVLDLLGITGVVVGFGEGVCD